MWERVIRIPGRYIHPVCLGLFARTDLSHQPIRRDSAKLGWWPRKRESVIQSGDWIGFIFWCNDKAERPLVGHSFCAPRDCGAKAKKKRRLASRISCFPATLRCARSRVSFVLSPALSSSA